MREREREREVVRGRKIEKGYIMKRLKSNPTLDIHL
jgi:hypothetical protein